MSFKDSGVEWIGKIPSHWGISKIKYQTEINKYTLNDQTSDDYIIQYIDIGNVNSEGQIQELQEYKFSDAPSRARRIVKKNDLLISTVRTYLKAITSILDDVEENVICSTGFAVLTPKRTMNPLYLHYLSRSEMYIDEIVSRSTGVSYPAINAIDIGALECILPPLDEQHLIGSFLHRKSTEVESIIQSKLKYITLLEQQRQSIITEAVTKGLNPNVKMKDSGVEWIGEIPEHWEVKPLYSLYKENKMKNKGNEIKNVLSLSYGKIKRRDVESNYGLLPDSFETYQILKKDDIVLRLTDLQNDKRSLRVGLVNEDGIITSAYLGLKQSTISASQYTYYLLHSYDLMKVFYGLGSGVRQSMGYTEMKKLPILLPPFEEQLEIIEFLKIKVPENESVIELLKKQIEKLKEYRQALIYEVVTGKIDVRELELD